MTYPGAKPHTAFKRTVNALMMASACLAFVISSGVRAHAEDNMVFAVTSEPGMEGRFDACMAEEGSVYQGAADGNSFSCTKTDGTVTECGTGYGEPCITVESSPKPDFFDRATFTGAVAQHSSASSSAINSGQPEGIRLVLKLPRRLVTK